MSKNQTSELTKHMERAAKALEETSQDKVITLISHNDTDGLSSAAIMQKTFERLGRKVKYICLEQMYNVPISRIYQKAGGPVIIMDLGISDRQLELIRDLNKDGLTVILDHHGVTSNTEVEELEKERNLFDINCTKYGLNGDRDASASTITYLFASKLTDITDISHLAVLGALGDKNHTRGEKGEFSENSLDKEVLKLTDRLKEENGIKKILLPGMPELLSTDQIISDTTLLGSVGYRKSLSIPRLSKAHSGPELGMRLLLKGYTNIQIGEIIENLRKLREDAYKNLTDYLIAGHYTESDSLIFFNTRNFFRKMGVKTVGTFCEHLTSLTSQINLPFLNPNKYIMGEQFIAPIPLEEGLIDAFKLSRKQFKISIRTCEELKKKIEQGERLSIYELLTSVNPNRHINSHNLRGATIVAEDKIDLFLETCERAISGQDYAALK